MVIKRLSAAALSIMLIVAGCALGHHRDHSADLGHKGEFVWQLPEGFPVPLVPADNPMTWDKIELGRRLFHDTRLSGDGSVSCASCHHPERAYTDGRGRAVGINGNIHPRSAMSLTNVAYNATLGWDAPTLTRLEDQVLVPLYNTQPPEMGVTGRGEAILSRLKQDRRLRRLFHRAFPQDVSPVSMGNVIYALASFERTLISGDTPYDRWAYGGDPDALDEAQRAGARLFFSNRLNCFRCHAGFNFSGPVRYEGSDPSGPRFHHTALFNPGGIDPYAEPNTGLHRHTGQVGDMGKFRAPTLRNIALTAPYMHDGSISTLGQVIDHYAAGGRSFNNPHSSAAHAKVDPLMTGFKLTREEKKQLIAFLHALTDRKFVREALKQAASRP